METKAKTGAEKATNAVADKKATQFVAGNPVNAVSQKVETDKEPKTDPAKDGFVNVNKEVENAKSEPTKVEIKKVLLKRLPSKGRYWNATLNSGMN